MMSDAAARERALDLELRQVLVALAAEQEQNRNLGVIVERAIADAARYQERTRRLEEALWKADAWFRWCGPEGDGGVPEPEFPGPAVSAALDSAEADA